MDYQTLQERVRSYLDNRTDLTTNIQNWINDTRKDLALKPDRGFSYLYVEATCETSASSARYALPSDYIRHLNIFIGAKKLIRLMPDEFDSVVGVSVDRLSTDTASQYLYTTESMNQSEPDYYIDRGVEFDLYPIPDGTYTLLLKYYAFPEDFTSNTDYDYISTFHFEAVIWGAALRGAMFLDDKEKLGTYAAAYGAAIKEMLKNEKDRYASDNIVRVKTYKDFAPGQLQRIMKIRTS